MFLMSSCLACFNAIPEPWQCFIYQYGLGGFFFFFTLGIALEAKTISWSTRVGKQTLILIIGGFFLAAAVHAAWIAKLV